jgi:hypothetical protein
MSQSLSCLLELPTEMSTHFYPLHIEVGDCSLMGFGILLLKLYNLK